MCGILGVVDFGKELDYRDISIARDLMLRRGPDDFGQEEFEFEEAKVHLSHRRLSIINLDENGKQPLIDAKNRFAIIFNGEIYNYKELRKRLIALGYCFFTEGDTEVILAAYEYWGLGMVDEFLGMFAIAILDIYKQEVILLRDRTGVKPLYFADEEGRFIFGSDLLSVSRLMSNRPNVNLVSLPSLLKFGYLNFQESPVSGVKKVEPGCGYVFEIKGRRLSKKRYWDIKNISTNGVQPRTQEKLEDIFKSAFGLRMVSDVPVGLFLSGGYDSSLVAAIIKSEGYDFKTFSIAFADAEYNEGEYAKKVSKLLGLRHEQYVFDENDVLRLVENLPYVLDEPIADTSIFPTTVVSELAANEVKVVLSADGADEIFGGYITYLRAVRLYHYSKRFPSFLGNMMSKLPKQKSSYILSLLLGRKVGFTRLDKLQRAIRAQSLLEFHEEFSSEGIENFFYGDFLNDIESKSSRMEKVISNGFDKNDINSLLAYDFINYLEGNILKKVDRATMFNSIEGREPFLDHRIVEHAQVLPNHLKVSADGGSKKIIKEICHKYLPEQLMNRPKQGFELPLNKWVLRNEKLRQLFFDSLSDTLLKDIGVLRIDQLTLLKNQFLMDGETGFNILWSLFTFLRWKNRLEAI